MGVLSKRVVWSSAISCCLILLAVFTGLGYQLTSPEVESGYVPLTQPKIESSSYFVWNTASNVELKTNWKVSLRKVAFSYFFTILLPTYQLSLHPLPPAGKEPPRLRLILLPLLPRPPPLV